MATTDPRTISRVDVEPGAIASVSFVDSARRIRVVSAQGARDYDTMTGERMADPVPVAAAPTDRLPWREPTVVAMTADGAVIVAAYVGGRVRVAHTAALDDRLQVARAIEAGAEVGRVAISDDGERVLTASGDAAALWEMAESRSLRTMRVSADGFAWSGSGNALATVLSDQLVVRNMPGGSVALTLPYPSGAAYGLSPDGATLAIATGDGHVAVVPTTISPPKSDPQPSPPPPTHWSDGIGTVSPQVRDVLLAWGERDTANNRRVAITDVQHTIKASSQRVVLTEYARDSTRGTATKVVLDVAGGSIRNETRREIPWRSAALAVSGARCEGNGGIAICFATATNKGGTPIPIEVSILRGADEIAHGVGALTIASNASVDIAIRPDAPIGASKLTMCVYSLAQTGGVSCSDVPVE